MNNQSLYKLAVLGAIFSFCPLFCFFPFFFRICGCQLGGAFKLGNKIKDDAMSFIRGK